MNDSFLEDLNLIPKDSKAHSNTQPNNRYITTRKVLSQSTNIQPKEKSNIDLKRDKIISSSTLNVSKIKVNRRSGSQENSKLSEPDTKPRSSTPKSERKKVGDENCIKPVDIPPKKELDSKSKSLKKLQNIQPAKDRRTSGGSGSSSKCSDSSGKENTRPSNEFSSSRESGFLADVKKDSHIHVSDKTSRKSGLLNDTDPVVLLNAIKDLVSRCAEHETTKVLKSMQNLHINSQANLIKHLMMQTDELVQELNLHKSPENIKLLIEENEKMREDIFILRTRNEVLQKKINELTLLKEENTSLKLKLKELNPQVYD